MRVDSGGTRVRLCPRVRAFERAIEDSGVNRDEVDGLSVTFLYGGPEPRRLAVDLGLRPRHVLDGGGVIPVASAVNVLAAGKCSTVALVYAVAARSLRRQYGGQTYQGDGRDSYYYYHPWGWSSQAAHWAFILRRYMSVYGVSEARPGRGLRGVTVDAARNPNAIMRQPLTIGDYLAARYVVSPIRLLDLCLVNDGGVCLVLRRRELSHDLAHPPVFVAGWGEAAVSHSKMRSMVVDRLQPQLRHAFEQACSMAKTTAAEIGHFEAYDPSTIHLINQLEGYGFVEAGSGLGFCQEGEMDLGGSLPVNTNGGLLSEAYMHGWNNIVESVRQLRHEAGDRQVPGVMKSLFSFATTDAAHPIILSRGE